MGKKIAKTDDTWDVLGAVAGAGLGALFGAAVVAALDEPRPRVTTRVIYTPPPPRSTRMEELDVELAYNRLRDAEMDVEYWERMCALGTPTFAETQGRYNARLRKLNARLAYDNAKSRLRIARSW